MTFMSRTLWFVIFLTVVLLVIGSLHYYLWARLIRAPAMPRPWNTVFTLLLAALAVSIPLAVVRVPALAPVQRVLVWPALFWLGLMFLLFVLLLVGDAGRL